MLGEKYHGTTKNFTDHIRGQFLDVLIRNTIVLVLIVLLLNGFNDAYVVFIYVTYVFYHLTKYITLYDSPFQQHVIAQYLLSNDAGLGVRSTLTYLLLNTDLCAFGQQWVNVYNFQWLWWNLTTIA